MKRLTREFLEESEDDSDVESSDSSEEPPKKKRKLNLPKWNSNMKSDEKQNVQIKQENEMIDENGKQRRYKHEIGNWSVSISIPIKFNKRIQSVIDLLCNKHFKLIDDSKLSNFNLKQSHYNILNRNINAQIDKIKKEKKEKEKDKETESDEDEDKEKKESIDEMNKPILPNDVTYENNDKIVRKINLNDSLLYHISLCITQPIFQFQIDTFVDCIKKSLSKIEKFEISFYDNIKDDIKMLYFANDIKTRFFAGLGIDSESQEKITTIIRLVDKTMKQFSLTPYYHDPISHVSLVWSCLPFDESATDNQDCSIKKLAKYDLMDVKNDLKARADKVQLKIGHRVYQINLN